jgi:glycosidase
MPSSLYTNQLTKIYGQNISLQIVPRLQSLINGYREHIPPPASTALSQRDSILITYADQLQKKGQAPLKTLNGFCQSVLHDFITGVHLLPFYPYSSDDGFSVKDYRAVDPSFGDWHDVERLGCSFRLMIDGVINHASVQGQWFKAFLNDEKPYRDYFITVKGSPDLSMVVRPRTTPLITTFQTKVGQRRVWTTFGADQADLDYHNPEVLLEIFDILLNYIRKGAKLIRLDAIAYLWKEIGTQCIHLPQTHAIIRLLRSVINDVAPHVLLVTETNVNHEENISYFGDGYDEAQLVYNFALPPLVLHTFRTGDAAILSEWASELKVPSDRTTYLNFLASHDGIGLNPAGGFLSTKAIEALVEQTRDHDGFVSYKEIAGKEPSPYELNINYFDALSNPHSNEPLSIQVDRFMAAQAIMLSLCGVPGIYFHSLFGSRNWSEGVSITGYKRSINRQKLLYDQLLRELADQNSLRCRVFKRFRHLLLQRAACSAFDPYGEQKILDFGNGIFAVLRLSPHGEGQILCLQNVTQKPQPVHLPGIVDSLAPYQTLWVNNPPSFH